MRILVTDAMDMIDDEKDDEAGSLEEGLASRRIVERHEKPMRYSRKIDHRTDEDMDD